MVAALLTVIMVNPVCCDDLASSNADLFENYVRPTFVRHCIKCHGSSKQEGGLKLTTLQSLIKGGETGPAITPGQPDESLLIEALRFESVEMPPDGMLDDKTIAGISKWIKEGARWPRGVELKPTSSISKEAQNWWCYQPLTERQVPQVEDSTWCRNEIDHFILSRLNKAKIKPAKQAAPRQLVRRIHFALTGLPPAPDQTDYQSSNDPWYPQLVDRLLDNDAYGENQARFWLDLVRYADSDGYNADHGRPHAHQYRDYVIRAFNQDKPYDQFILEQLAGDELKPGNRDALIATMYLRHWIYEWNQRDVEGQWKQILNDVTETTADVFLAQGLKCARCHDHKFDPLLQKDYYAFKSFFAPLQPREDQPIADVQTRAKYFKQQKKWEQATEEIRQRLHEIETPVLLKHATREGFDKFTKEIQSMITKRRHDRTPYEHQIASLASNQFDLHPEKLAQWLDKETEAERQRLKKQLAAFDHLKPAPLPTMKFVVSDVGLDAPPTTIPDIENSQPVLPGFPVVLGDPPAKIQRPHPALQTTGRRTALARWIASPQNPLTARVMVNRVWQQHFGRGLVATTSDFGHLGAPPSHPELLDWLASKFIADGWSLKKLHRLILNSATYRQSAVRPMDARLSKLDPQNLLLWRMNPRRLSGEEIHDALLAASGELSQGKRAIYKPVKRNRLDPLLAAFDFPDRVESHGIRHRTTTSPQALLLMNNPWFQDRALRMASQLPNDDPVSIIQQAYQRIYFRTPSADELEQATRFLQSYEAVTPPPERVSRVAKFPSSRSALVLNSKQPTSIQIAPIKDLYGQMANGDFSIEAVVLLKSLYPDASVRTIVANWSNKNSERGWSLGVTSTKSAYKPRNLILQLIGSRNDQQGKPEYEVVASNLRMDLNKPYYVAVSIKLDDTSKQGITFYLKDLSNPKAKLQVAQVAHQARWNVQPNRPIEIGGRAHRHRWDGLIQSVRIQHQALNRLQLVGQSDDLPKRDPPGPVVFDIRFDSDKNLGKDRSGKGRHAKLDFGKTISSPKDRATVALLHALLCSSETIYVD